MIKGGQFSKLLLIGIFFLLLSFLKWGISFPLGTLLFVLGGIFGYILLEIDQFLYVFYTRPEEINSVTAIQLFKNRRYKEMVFFVLSHRDERKQLILHSAIMAPVLFLLSVFIITSSGSIFGMGLVLGIFLRYILDLGFLYKQGSFILKEKFFWQVKGEIDDKNQKIYLLLILFGFIFSSLLFLG